MTYDLTEMEKACRVTGMETALLACFMRDPSTIDKAIARGVTEKNMYNENNTYLFKCMLWMREKASQNSRKVVFDIPSMLQTVQSFGGNQEDFVNKAGGMEYLNNLKMYTMADIGAVDTYIDHVLNASARIKAIQLASRVQSLAVTSDKISTTEFISNVENEMSSLTDLYESSGIVKMGHELQALLDDCKANKGNKTNGIFVSFLPQLMETLNGLRRKEMIVLFARPKTGKSGIFLNIAKDVAFNQQIPVLYIDSEMSLEEQQSRVLSSDSGVREWSILDGSFYDDEKALGEVMRTAEVMGQSPLYYVRAGGFSPDQLVHTCEEFIHKHVKFDEVNGKRKTRPCLIIYDWLKVPEANSSKREKEYQQLGDIATKLNDCVVKAYDVCLLCGAQANRMAAGKECTGSAAEYAQQFLADSDRILRFCTCLIWLRWLKQEEMDKANQLPPDKYFNQMLHVLDQRRGPKNLDGIPLQLMGENLRYTEKEYVDLEKMEVEQAIDKNAPKEVANDFLPEEVAQELEKTQPTQVKQNEPEDPFAE